jgi:hypothetical protein
MSNYDIGFWIGNGLYLLVFVLIFRFVRRWGWVGLIIRVICVAFILIRIVAILAFMNPG